MPAFIATTLVSALNHYLQLDPENLARLAPLDGKVIAVELEGLNQCFYLLAKADRLKVIERYEGEPTVWIRGAPTALFRRWRGNGGDLVIEGDITVAQALQALLTQSNIDWEEVLAQRVGDTVAHQLGNFWHGFRGWNQRAIRVLSRDGVEYLQQELRALPPRPVVERFLSDVDTLREDADRLTVRIERLRKQSAGSGSL